MKERPIIFSEMVKAILEGRKTQTRRVIKPQPISGQEIHPTINPSVVALLEIGGDGRPVDRVMNIKCPYGQRDRLWVRESHKLTKHFVENEWWVQCEYKFSVGGDNTHREFRWVDIPKPQRDRLNRIKTWGKWRSGRFMYKFLASIWLEITSIRAERLQEISGEDVDKEGVIYESLWGKFSIPDWDAFIEAQETIAIRAFAALWDSLNAKRGYAWEANPWVWAISFKV